MTCNAVNVFCMPVELWLEMNLHAAFAIVQEYVHLLVVNLRAPMLFRLYELFAFLLILLCTLYYCMNQLHKLVFLHEMLNWLHPCALHLPGYASTCVL